MLKRTLSLFLAISLLFSSHIACAAGWMSNINTFFKRNAVQVGIGSLIGGVLGTVLLSKIIVPKTFGESLNGLLLTSIVHSFFGADFQEEIKKTQKTVKRTYRSVSVPRTLGIVMRLDEQEVSAMVNDDQESDSFRKSVTIGGSTITCCKSDIFNEKVDVIVNPANSRLRHGGGLCGKIFKRAGAPSMTEKCKRLLKKMQARRLKVASAVKTGVGHLEGFKKIIHVVSPNFNSGNSMQRSRLFDEEGKAILAQCYTNILKKAAQMNLYSISIPLLSSGCFCRQASDREEISRIAVQAIKEFCVQNKNYAMDIRLVLAGWRVFGFSIDELKKENECQDLVV